MDMKTAQFVNRTGYKRREIGYATIPFKQGEWTDQDLIVRDAATQQIIKDAHVEPFGAKYPDGSHRFGALCVRLTLDGYTNGEVEVLPSTGPVSPPVFVFSEGARNFINSKIVIKTVVNRKDHLMILHKWTSIEDTPLRQVFQARQRIDNTDFVADFKLYVYSDQDIAKWELRITGSNPDNTNKFYTFDEIGLALVGDGFMNIRWHKSRGVDVLLPGKHYKLLDGPSYFGDGQCQSFYGELLLPSFSDELTASTMRAAIEFPFLGMSTDWKRDEEAFGPYGHIPDTPLPLRDGGYEGSREEFKKMVNVMTRQGAPWDEWYLGLLNYPGATGRQPDFGLLEGWDVLYTGFAELLEGYYYLAQEDLKRPSHYVESNGEPITSKDHPQWITWGAGTHWSHSVSKDRLGKTDPNATYMGHGWGGKDWGHFTSNLLYIATLLTGSYMLRDEMDVEAEIWLAGHTTPDKYPNWSTNSIGVPRGFGRPQLAVLQHNMILDRQDIVDKALARFRQNITTVSATGEDRRWVGAKVSGPVKIWQVRTDARLLGATVPAWTCWNECLGWKGMVALYNVTQDPDVRDLMVTWGTALLHHGWYEERDANGDLLNVEIGHAIRFKPDGQALTQSEKQDSNFFRPGDGTTLWGTHLLKYIKDSDLFSAESRALAAEYYDMRSRERLSGYNVYVNPFDEFGKWDAIK